MNSLMIVAASTRASSLNIQRTINAHLHTTTMIKIAEVGEGGCDAMWTVS
jgi:hypothetical protein